MLRILRFPGYFETPLFRTFFHFPWDFEIAGFDCIYRKQQHKKREKKELGRTRTLYHRLDAITPNHYTTETDDINLRKGLNLGTGQKVYGGWAGAFGNVVDKKHMTHPLPSAQK